jgi:hypothetical protein
MRLIPFKEPRALTGLTGKLPLFFCRPAERRSGSSTSSPPISGSGSVN